MPKRQDFFLDKMLKRRVLLQWQQKAEMAAHVDLKQLKSLRSDAQALRREVNRVLHLADGRLSKRIGDDGILRPLGTDWVWRPELWSGPITPAGLSAPETRSRLGSEITLFHDCRTPELVLRQYRNTQSEVAAPFGLALEVFGFDGTFLSLALDLPPEGVNGLNRHHLLRLSTRLRTERPLAVYCRLNVKHGPNTEQLVRELPNTAGDCWVEFDLAYTRLNAKRLEKAWIDLIFDAPGMNRIDLNELSIVRHPRADI